MLERDFALGIATGAYLVADPDDWSESLRGEARFEQLLEKIKGSTAAC